MDLETITTVLAVARTKSFSAASYAIPCAQSSVSRRVKAAESELNVKIFVRPADSSDSTLQLTPIGERIISILEDIVEDYRELFVVASEKHEVEATVRVGFMNNIMPPSSFSSLKAEFFLQHPSIIIETYFDRMDGLLTELKRRSLDMVLFSCNSIDFDECPLPEQFDIQHLGSVPFTVGISEKNPLSTMDSVSMSDFDNEIFYINASPFDAIAGIDFLDEAKLINSLDVKPLHVQKLPDHMLEIRYLLTRNDKGIYLSDTPSKWRNMLGISYIKVTELEGQEVNYYLLTHKGTKSQEQKALIRYFTAAINSNDPPLKMN